MHAFGKRILALLLIAALLSGGVACAQSGAKNGGEDVDLFDMDLRIKIEHTYKEGDTYCRLALFADGQHAMYQSTEPGVLPEIRDLKTGKAQGITLSANHLEDVEFAFRTSVVMQAKRLGVKDTTALEEKVASLHGLDIFRSSPNPIGLRAPEYSVTAAKSDLLCLADNNSGVGGMFDPNAGTLYNGFRDGGGTFEPYSAYGTKVLGRYNATKAAILDTSDLSFRVIGGTDAFGFSPKQEEGWFNTLANLAYLADGSIAALITEQKYTDGEMFETDTLAILRPDGGTEQYAVSDERMTNGFRIVSNDPMYVIAEPAIMGFGYPRMIDRKTGEVTALKLDGSKIDSVPLSEVVGDHRPDGTFCTLDVLNDGHTLLIRNGNTGGLGIFDPETLRTKLIKGEEDTLQYCMYFSGDHRGNLCASYLPRDRQPERGVMISITDKNGDPILP